MSGYERNMYRGWASIKAQATISTHICISIAIAISVLGMH
jgi:hypothetical protein